MFTRLNKLLKRWHVYRFVSYFLILLAIGIIALTFLPLKRSSISSVEFVIRNTEAPTLKPSTTEEPTPQANTSLFVKNGNFKINQLVTRYYEALLSNDDGRLSKYTDNVDDIDPQKRIINSKYIDAYTNINCYVMNGLIPATYIAVITYEVMYKGYSASVPYVEYLYIGTDLSGNLYVTNSSVGDEISAYNELMFENSTIKEVVSIINSEYQKIKSHDEALSNFLDSIQ